MLEGGLSLIPPIFFKKKLISFGSASLNNRNAL
jgi:hypothetical protein